MGAKFSPTPRLLIVGASETGKTTLAKMIARELEKRTFAVTVYDPLISEWSPDALVSGDEEEFFSDLDAQYQAGKRQAVFIDEADTILSVAHRRNFWVLTRGRHFLLSPHVITQRPALVAPTIRGQCNQAYVFQVSTADAKLLADDFACEGLRDAPNLQQGEYLHVHWKNKIKTLDRGRIF